MLDCIEYQAKSKSWLKLVFLRDQIREKRGRDRILATNNKSVTQNSEQNLASFFIIIGKFFKYLSMVASPSIINQQMINSIEEVELRKRLY